VYDKANYAKLVAFTQYVPVLADMTEELDKIDPALGSNPLINPPQDMKDRLHTWAALTDEQTQQFNTAYASVTGS
jgi:spermidine/putrescine transport system substrate-binding protein